MGLRCLLLALLVLLADCRSEQAAFSAFPVEQSTSSQLDSRADLTSKIAKRSSPQDSSLATAIPLRARHRRTQKLAKPLKKYKFLTISSLIKVKKLKRFRLVPASHSSAQETSTKGLFYLLLTLLLFLGGIFLVFLATKSLILANLSFSGIALGVLVALLGLAVVLLLVGIFFLAFWPDQPVAL